LNTWNSQGPTVGYVGVDGKFALVFSVADQIRPEAAEAVRDLKVLNLTLSGGYFLNQYGHYILLVL